MKFKSVFDCYPDADKIFVVGDMPFLNAGEAGNHAKMVSGNVEIVTRASMDAETTVLEPFIDAETAAKLMAEKEAADKAKAEADALEAAEKAAAAKEKADATAAKKLEKAAQKSTAKK